MSKRPGENLARTTDGSAYNKLQRPEHWPVEPARPRLANDEHVLDEDAALNDLSSVVVLPKRNSKQKSRDKTRKSRKLDNGCLPLDDDDFSGSENVNDVSFAALQYLKSVRAQAEDLPLVHAAPNEHTPSEDEHRGYFEDGAYTAAPQHGPDLPEEDYDAHEWDEDGHNDGACQEDARHRVATHLTPCEAYTGALLLRFHRVRTAINTQKMMPGFLHDAPAIQLRVSRRLDKTGRLAWKDTMAKKAPDVSTLAATIVDSLINLLEILKQDCMPRSQNISKTTGLWLLALLASIDGTTIDSDIVYELRELAKRAIWLRIDFEPRFAEASKLMGEENGYIDEGDDDIESNAGAVNENLVASSKSRGDGDVCNDFLVHEPVPDDVTKAILDMVVVIVGEVFGQRDLLESRRVVDWPDMSEGTDPAVEGEADIQNELATSET